MKWAGLVTYRTEFVLSGVRWGSGSWNTKPLSTCVGEANTHVVHVLDASTTHVVHVLDASTTLVVHVLDASTTLVLKCNLIAFRENISQALHDLCASTTCI